MNPECLILLERLAEGNPVSGQALAEDLGISRAAVWKRVQSLRASGLAVKGRPGGGYRLPWPVSMLDSGRIAAALADEGIAVEVHPVLASTNTALAASTEPHCRLILAEFQTRGRGRRGRTWQSPPAGGICLSFGYRFECGLPGLGPLSLVAGLAAARALEEACRVIVGLKWPNDLVIGGRKLGGLLVEISGAADGPCDAIIGLGLNVRMPPASVPGQPWIDLHGAGSPMLDRSELAIALARSLNRTCGKFQSGGFGSFREAWSKLDVLAGHPVEVVHADGRRQTGIACGVNDRGALLLESPSGRRALAAGEVSVRAS